MIGRIAKLLGFKKPVPGDEVVGYLFARGSTVPSDGATGYAKGCIFQQTDGSEGTVLYVNEGSVTSADFNAVASLTAAQEALLGATAGVVTASKAVVVDSNKDAASFRNVTVTNLDAGASGTAGSLDVFPSTASKGKLTIDCANQDGNTTVTLRAAAMAQASVISIPDPGAATANVLLTDAANDQTVCTASAADLSQSAAGTKVWTLHPLSFKVFDAWKDDLPDAPANDDLGVADAPGSPMVTSTADGVGTAQITQKALALFELPAEYVDGGTITARVRAKRSAAPQVSGTVDVIAKKYSDGALGADICATAAQALTGTDTYANFDFTITPTGLVRGDVIALEVDVALDDTGGTNSVEGTVSHVQMRLNAR